jgi:hypothetical protein
MAFNLPTPYRTGTQAQAPQYQAVANNRMQAPNPMAQPQEPEQNPMMQMMQMKGIQSLMGGNPMNGAQPQTNPMVGQAQTLPTDPNTFAGNQDQSTSMWSNSARDLVGANTSANYGVQFGPPQTGQTMPQLPPVRPGDASFFPQWMTGMFGR